MDVVLGFGARTAACTLCPVASVIDPPEKHPVVTSCDFSLKESGVLIPESVVAQQEVVVIDNKTVSMASVNLDNTVVTLPESEVVSAKRKIVTSPLFCSIPRHTKKGAPTTESNVGCSQIPNEYMMGLLFLFEQMDDIWMDVPSQCSFLMDCGAFDKERLHYCKTVCMVYQPMYETELSVIWDLFAVAHGQHLKGDKPFPITDTETREHLPNFDSFPKSITDFDFVKTRQIEEDLIPWLSAYERVSSWKHKKGSKKTKC